MTTFEWAMIYIISWWMVLFMVLPFGAHVPEKVEASHYHGAPDRVNLKRKLLITSVLALVVTLSAGWVISQGWIKVS